jgi:hypothetical protein
VCDTDDDDMTMNDDVEMLNNEGPQQFYVMQLIPRFGVASKT